MLQSQYKSFSLKTHKRNWRDRKPNSCQFELTFKCGLHCSYCYSDCYNKPAFIRKELDTSRIKSAIDKLHDLGVLWLCFTGGDCLERKDFLEIYSYARGKGFIISLFTTGYSMTAEIAGNLEKNPPFVIEITINGSNVDTYEKITQVKGSYGRTIKGLDLILKKNLPLKVKTMAIKQNYEDLSGIKKFLEAKRIEFRPSASLQARLNGDSIPCSFRLDPQEIGKIDESLARECMGEEKNGAGVHGSRNKEAAGDNRLFQCAIGGGDGLNLDPYGNMFACSCIRHPAINFLESGLEKIRKTIFGTFPRIANTGFKTDSICRKCGLRSLCRNCPGKAFLETGDKEAPVRYFCELARAQAKTMMRP
jgi:radical SAM protein with 4Fe4S-binding SPASM domain